MSRFVKVLRNRWFRRGVVAFVVFYAVSLLFIYRAMEKPPEQFARTMSKLPAPVVFLAFPFEALWMRARAGHLQVGDPAPDFELAKQDKSERLHLAAMTAQQPVVLVFGSYT